MPTRATMLILGLLLWAVAADRGVAEELVYTTATSVGPRMVPRALLVDDGTGSTKELTPLGVGVMTPCWSPDGAALAFCGDIRSGFALHTMAIADGVARPIVEGFSTSTPAWSPDGAWIAFTALTSGASGVFVVRPDGSDLRRLARGARPIWSPDGRHLAYYRTDIHPAEVGCLDVATGDERCLAGLGSFAMPAAALEWSRDGVWIFFTETATTTGGEGIGHVRKVRRFDGATVPVTSGLGERLLGISPDGETAVILRAEAIGGRRARLARVDLATGDESPLLDDEGNARLADLELFSGRTVTRFAWSASGGRIAFDLREPAMEGSGGVFLVDVDEGRLSVPLVTSGRFGTSLAWRPSR